MEMIVSYPMENVCLGHGKKVPRNRMQYLKIYSHFLRLIEFLQYLCKIKNVGIKCKRLEEI